MCVSEDWYINDEITTAKLDGYRLVEHFSRRDHSHGGVAIFCKEDSDVDAEPIEEISKMSVKMNFECAAIKFKSSIYKVIIACIYRSSSTGDFNIFVEKFELLLNKLSKYSNSHNVVICEDFNVNFLEETRDRTYICDILGSYYFKPIIDQPTRGPNCLDNICISCDTDQYDAKVIPVGWSDHAATVLSLNKQSK
ncbi:hypothetical protein Zmor_013598 [Zophobas morio]|uniref:Endonuclease/exonuclease/phosphatase domain-containing protein n=1 Tax=Zophobas morio TaxID=2755281 RepID=A0AA38MCM1_9CUCU|nr:hypothetical protein Zmor_017444 [Zophobas morio]KAJ3654408.1 hypothetical protein Zmor_013598 [Zophobas morio]